MNVPQIIERKRDGGRLSQEEIALAVGGFARGDVPDYQMAALAMAIFFRGMDGEETAALTQCMLDSGARLMRSSAAPPRVDKHSTGGVGDKVSLVLAPLLACCGLHVPMISGRGVGAPGGTLDKLEAIPGFRTDLSKEEIQRVTDSVGCVITGQTEDLAPADKKLYALRDVTGTVGSLPLIAASIMSKKLAEDLDALVIDVKWGSGALMKTLEEAEQLAEALSAVGQSLGLKTGAVFSDMNQPLGRMVGHVVEIQEALQALHGGGPEDLMELVFRLAEVLLEEVGAAGETRKSLMDHIASGRALEKFHEMVHSQGGDLHRLPPIAPAYELPAAAEGYVTRIDTAAVGRAVAALGGARKKITDGIDHSVGLEMLVRLGGKVAPGTPLVRLFAHEQGRTEAESTLRQAVEICS